MSFQTYVGIDYSGTKTPGTRTPGLQVYQAARGDRPALIWSPASTPNRRRNWNRQELAQWIERLLERESGVVVGIDHGLSFPVSYFQRYQLANWDDFLDDFVRHWPTHQVDRSVEEFRDGSQRIGNAQELRLTECWTAGAKSVFQFDVPGSVAMSTHAGLPFIHRLRTLQADVHFWPFDGWSIPSGANVIAEVWPSLFRSRYDRQARNVHQQDAFAVCCWLEAMDSMKQLDRFFDPPLTAAERRVAELEGWILGVT